MLNIFCVYIDIEIEVANTPKIPLKSKRKQLKKIALEENMKRNQIKREFAEDCVSKPATLFHHKLAQNVERLQKADALRFQKLTKKMQSQRVKQLQEDNAKEEKMIKSLEKKLKLTTTKKGYLTKSFITEGLDCILYHSFFR